MGRASPDSSSDWLLIGQWVLSQNAFPLCLLMSWAPGGWNRPWLISTLRPVYTSEKNDTFIAFALSKCPAFSCSIPCLTSSPPNVERERTLRRGYGGKACVCTQMCVHGNRFGGCLDPDSFNAAGQLCLINTH